MPVTSPSPPAVRSAPSRATLVDGHASPAWLRLVVGLLGAYTTFSAFAHDVYDLALGEQLVRAGANAVASVVVGTLAVALGAALGRAPQPLGARDDLQRGEQRIGAVREARTPRRGFPESVDERPRYDLARGDRRDPGRIRSDHLGGDPTVRSLGQDGLARGEE